MKRVAGCRYARQVYRHQRVPHIRQSLARDFSLSRHTQSCISSNPITSRLRSCAVLEAALRSMASIMERNIKLSVHVIPPHSTTPSNSLTGPAPSRPRRQFLDICKADLTIGKLFLHILERCKEYYQEEKDYSCVFSHPLGVVG